MSDKDTEDKPKGNTNPDALVISNLMRSEDNRAYIWKHLQSCGVFVNIFDNDTIKHAYNSGMRAAGLKLDADIREYEPDYYIKMMKENM